MKLKWIGSRCVCSFYFFFSFLYCGLLCLYRIHSPMDYTQKWMDVWQKRQLFRQTESSMPVVLFAKWNNFWNGNSDLKIVPTVHYWNKVFRFFVIALETVYIHFWIECLFHFSVSYLKLVMIFSIEHSTQSFSKNI